MKKDLPYIFFITLITLFWFIIVFSDFQVVEQSDWDMVFGYHQSQRDIILKYHQFPLWNPYLCGGEPWLAHPVSDFLSPFFIFILFFGTIKGTIIAYFPQTLIGLLGMYFLSRHYGLSRNISLLSTIISLNIFNKITYIGIFIFLSFCFLPWIYLLFNKAKNEKKYMLYSIMLLAVIILTGYIYIFIMTLIFLFIDTIFYIAKYKKIKFILIFLGITIFALLLSAPKILPMLELLKQLPRITVFEAPKVLLNLDKFPFLIIEAKELLLPKESFYFLNRFINPDILQNIFYFIMTSIFIITFIMLWKKYKELLIIGLIFLLISLFNNSPFNLWSLLHFLLPSMGGPGKFAAVFIMTFSLSLGLVIKECQIKAPQSKTLKSIVTILVFLFTTSVFLYANMIFKTRDVMVYRLDNQQKKFSHKNVDPRNIFETIYIGRGVLSPHAINFFDAIGGQIPKKVLAKEEKGYRGEYYLLNGYGEVEQVMFSPNKMIFKLKLKDNDTLVINQNYFPGWRSSAGKITSYNGLISITLNQKISDLIIYYLPNSLISGIILFVLSLFTIGYGLKKGWFV